MPQHDDEGPVYYREIQKNSYLKRVPTESGSKLKPLGHKKPQLKPMWTLLCVHNGRTPYLEQYATATSPCAVSHSPLWRTSLKTCRHVTASVMSSGGQEHDFVIQTDSGLVRLRAPDWESMRSWVLTLRSRLHALQILSGGENLYQQPSRPPPAAPPTAAPAPPRAGTRDPTSPLPPTPSAVPDRVPGVELITATRPTQPPIPEATETETETAPEPEAICQPETSTPDTIDISDWDSTVYPMSLPSTSAQNDEPKNSVAKICGQNICLDDSILKRRASAVDDSVGENDGLDDSVEKVDDFVGVVDEVAIDDSDFKQRVVVTNSVEEGSSVNVQQDGETSKSTNITVIQVSNKPPHTAIPVMGDETNVFNFDVKPEPDEKTGDKYVNIVNTESHVQNTENGYGTVFSEQQYGHISLTTTVSLSGNPTVKPEGIYERLCMASTSNETPSPIPLRKLKLSDKSRKSSLPNLNTDQNSPYEYLYTSSNNVTSNDNSRVNAVNTNSSNTRLPNVIQINHRTEINSNVVTDQSLPSASNVTSSIPNADNTRSNLRLARNPITNPVADVNVISNDRIVRANVERSHSQNTSDAQRRDRVIQRQNGPKREANKNDKTEQPLQTKPIWKRGLTEFSLLSRLRGIGHKRSESPTRQENNDSRQTSSQLLVAPRSRTRTNAATDCSRRRSNSLTNDQCHGVPGTISSVRLEAHLAVNPPLLAQHADLLWIVSCSHYKPPYRGRLGDRLLSVAGTTPRSLRHANSLIHYNQHRRIDVLLQQVPFAKVYILHKESEEESVGIKVDLECTITSIDANSPAERAGLPPPGLWSVTEVNHQPVNILKGGQKDINRLSSSRREVTVLIQPAPLIKKLRSSLFNKRIFKF